MIKKKYPLPSDIGEPLVIPPPSKTPAHYNKPVQPWHLEKYMESSGNCFVDSRRTDVIEYCYRNKGDMLGDLRKALHCLEEAIKVLEEQQPNITP